MRIFAGALIAAAAALAPHPASAAACDPAGRNNPAFADQKPGAAWCVNAPEIVPAAPKPRTGCERVTAAADPNTIYNDGTTSVTMHGSVTVDIVAGSHQALRDRPGTHSDRPSEAARCP